MQVVSLDIKSAPLDMMIRSDGRAGTNTPEPDFISLLHSLKLSWNTTDFEKVTEPLLAEVDTQELSNANKARVYDY